MGIGLLMVGWLVVSAPDGRNTDIARVQEAYAKGGDFSAKFTHTYVEKLRGKKKVESGQLWAKRDGRVLWAYDKPAKREFRFDGKQASFYEPEYAQVTIFDSFMDSPLWNALRFLWGQGSLTETFDVRACDAACGGDDLAQADGVKLVPKQVLPAVDHVVLFIDKKVARIDRSVVVDGLGNRTQFDFTDITLGAKVDAALFDFKPPKGVSVLYASGAGPK